MSSDITIEYLREQVIHLNRIIKYLIQSNWKQTDDGGMELEFGLWDIKLTKDEVKDGNISLLELEKLFRRRIDKVVNPIFNPE